VGKRRTRITIEMDEIVVARRISSQVMAWCEKCQKETGMVTLSQAAFFPHVDISAIHRWIDSGELHMSEKPGTDLLICITSLKQHALSNARTTEDGTSHITKRRKTK
jgi:hypothetical protein